MTETGAQATPITISPARSNQKRNIGLLKGMPMFIQHILNTQKNPIQVI